VLDIQRFSLHDGPGIRTTVFLKGCPLRCDWCCNPEGLEPRPQIRLKAEFCSLCGQCARVCEQAVHEVKGEQHLLRPATCVLCGRCIEACPIGALDTVGREMTVEEVLAVVRRDEVFYRYSGGGMTLSGGEPLMQLDFARDLLEQAKSEGIHTAVETAAFCPWENLQALAPLVDLFFVDLKHTDDARHRALTGVSNEGILSNIRRMTEARMPMVLRVPWIRTRNIEESFLDGLASFLASIPEPPPVELMLYRRLGLSKWKALGAISPMPGDVPAATAKDAVSWMERLSALGISVSAL